VTAYTSLRGEEGGSDPSFKPFKESLFSGRDDVLIQGEEGNYFFDVLFLFLEVFNDIVANTLAVCITHIEKSLSPS